MLRPCTLYIKKKSGRMPFDFGLEIYISKPDRVLEPHPMYKKPGFAIAIFRLRQILITN